MKYDNFLLKSPGREERRESVCVWLGGLSRGSTCHDVGGGQRIGFSGLPREGMCSDAIGLEGRAPGSGCRNPRVALQVSCYCCWVGTRGEAASAILELGGSWGEKATVKGIFLPFKHK